MNCADARDAMLVAEGSEFQRAARLDSPLATHLADCARCRGLADAIADGTAQIRVLVTARPSARVKARRPMARRIAVFTVVPLAAAALVAITLNGWRPERVAAPTHSHSLPVARHVSLDVARGQRAAVLKTANPAVTVIWLTPGESQ